MKPIISASYIFIEEETGDGRRLGDVEAVDVIYLDGSTERFSGPEDVALIGNIIFQQQRSFSARA